MAPRRPAPPWRTAVLAAGLAAGLALGGGCGGGAAPPPRSGAVPGDGTGGLALPAALCGTPAPPAAWPGPVQTVGSGTPASCTEAALDEALARGGVIRFACGPDPVIFHVSSEKAITRDTWLDGGGLVTLSGGGATRILAIHGSFERAGPHLRVERLTFRDGRARGTAIALGTDVDGGGGAIFHLGGTVTAVDCRFIDNTAATWGPDVAGGAITGIGNPAATAVYRSAFRGNRAANGGAVGSLHTAVTLVDSVLLENEATGRGANAVDGSGRQVGHGGNGGALSMDGEHRTLSICGTTFRANRAGAFGGAVFRTSYHEEATTIDRATLDANVVADEPTSGAGAAYLQGSRVTITDSTVSRNRAANSPGLRFHDHVDAQARADLTNVTIVENAVHERADPSANGLAGGLWTDGVDGTLANCTVARNRAGFAAGILGLAGLTLVNTIVANEAANAYVNGNCHDFAGAKAAGARVLQQADPGQVQDGDCLAAGVARGDPLLGPLAPHGGPTETAVPGAGSPAIGAGAACPPADQRGAARPAACALGAVEPP
jgi:hypothetical protein